MDYAKIGDVSVSRFILGSNPFSGFSHQGIDMDWKMMRYFSAAAIKRILREAEALGVNTIMGRTDHHVMRVLLEYWEEGGKIQWFAQTCPGVGSQPMCVGNAKMLKAKACHIHGGYADNLYLNGKIGEVPEIVKMIRDEGMLVGLAGHMPEVFKWAEENVDVDYYACCYYNTIPRLKDAAHVRGYPEWFHNDDRKTMTDLIQNLSKPVIHYKIMAAGRNDPQEAFAFAARSMRPNDMVCVGIYDEEKPNILREDVELLEAGLAEAKEESFRQAAAR